MEVIKSTTLGKVLRGDSIELLSPLEDESVDLIFSSPPYDIITQKKYGNKTGDEYQDWMTEFGKEFFRVLKPKGSLVLDFGGGWESGLPAKNLYEYRLLLNFCDNIGFYLAQDFFWWDPTRLPTPAQWVTVERVRVKDAVNKIWWFSKTPNPKANNKNVLQKYSRAMEETLEKGTNIGKRQSGHSITKNFQKNNGGAIPPNLIAVSNSISTEKYADFCKEHKLTKHPARIHPLVPEFFIRMLTDENDLVIDPFAGSCVTGAVCESLKRQWICCDKVEEYLLGAMGRFLQEEKIPAKTKHKKTPEYTISAPNFDLHNKIKEEPLFQLKQFPLFWDTEN